MPGLVACGRRWDVGSDDFVFPGLGELFVRVVWLLAVAIVYDKHKDGFDQVACSHGNLHVYCIGMMVVLTTHILLDVAVVSASMRGSIINPAPRRRLPIMLYLKMFTFLPELAFTILGTVWSFGLTNHCDYTVLFAMRATALAGWGVMIVVLLGLLVVFDPLGAQKIKRAGLMEDEDRTSAAKRLWEMRCRILCCCAAQDEHSTNAFNDVSQLITDFFKGLDVVPTDIAAGLILVHIEQGKQPKRMYLETLTHTIQPRRAVEGAAPSALESINDDVPFPHPEDWMTIPLAAHYMKFASGSYGWALYMYSDLCTGGCKLCPRCTCCACTRAPDYIMDDNCCGCNTAAIIKTTGIREEDIIYASFYNRVYQIPFYVALDHRNKAVVVAIRGTLSLRDALTDLTVDSEPLDVAGVQGGLAHKGIMQAARFIQSTLENLQLLQKAFEQAPGYRLVVTGHSLGAGAASILSILLRPQYPDLRCFAFSPPGWLISLPLARYTEDFIFSVVVGRDLIPRLGFLTMEQLKTQILKVIRHTQVPKYKVLTGGVWYFFMGRSRLEEDVSSSRESVRPLLVNGNSMPRYTEDFNQSLDDAILTCSKATRNQETPLYLPGHVLYLEEVERSSRWCGTATYNPAWARPESFDEIIVSPRMIQDHIPDAVTRALDQLVEKNISPRHLVKIYNTTAAVV